MDFSSVSVVRPYEQIVKQIQQAIRDGQLPRGMRLPTERELSEQFGVSRSVVREAIKVLDTMGLVESRQGSGLYVRNSTIESVSRAFTLSVSPDAESVDRLFEFRQTLEMEAARLAAERRTNEHLEQMHQALSLVDKDTDPDAWAIFGQSDSQFHQIVSEASGNPYLKVAIATSRDMQRDVVSQFAKHSGMMQVAIEHHLAIMDAIVRQDAHTASARMADHIHYTSQVVQTHFPTTLAPAPGRPELRRE